MSPLLAAALMGLCLLAEAFFSGSEIGLVSADAMRLRHQAAKGHRGAQLALEMLKTPEWLLSTTLVGTNISVVTNTTLATALMIELLGEPGRFVAIAVAAPLIWVFGEIVPKAIFQQRADSLTLRVVYPLRVAAIVFSPILWFFTTLTGVLSRLLGSEVTNPFTLREELASMIRMAGVEGDIEPHEQRMIRRLFDFSETTALEVMRPRVELASVDAGATVDEVLALGRGSVLTVSAGRSDHVIGVLDPLDLLGRTGDEPIRPYVREVRFVPGVKSIRDLFAELRESGRDECLVVDEFGGIEGLVTIEDIMEEVVEEITDEFDRGSSVTAPIRRLGERHVIVPARMELAELAEVIGVELEADRASTLAGFLLELARDIPAAGTILRHRGISFTVHTAVPNRIEEVRIQW